MTSAYKNYLCGLRVRDRWQQGGWVLVGQAVRLCYRPGDQVAAECSQPLRQNRITCGRAATPCVATQNQVREVALVSARVEVRATAPGMLATQ